MALDPNIPLAARSSDLSQIGQSFSRGIRDSLAVEQFRERRGAVGQERELGRQQIELNEQKLLQNQFNSLDERQQRVTKSLIQGAASIESLVDSNDDSAIEFALNTRISRLNELGVDSSDTQTELKSFRENPDLFKQNVKSVINFGERLGFLKKVESQEGFTLGKGQQRFDAQGRVIAQTSQQEAFTLKEGERRFDSQGNTIAVGAKKEDKAPNDFRFTEDGNLEPIPGGKADFERKEGQERVIKLINLAEAKSSLVISKVDEALELIDKEFGVTGFTGKISGAVAGTDAFNLKKNLATIQANLGFDALQKMREASPTGGALGQVSERELDLLISAVAALDIGLSKDVIVKNLKEVKVHYGKWLETVKKANIQSQQQQEVKIRRFNPETGRIE